MSLPATKPNEEILTQSLSMVMDQTKMKKHMKKNIVYSLAFVLAVATLNVSAADVPGVLPKPDNTPPATDKPVKVYILSGQSNMVGFGTMQGSRPCYPSIFLSADPAVVPCRMPAGPSALLPHGIYQSAKENAAKGARVDIYQGAYSAETEYTSIRPEKETSVALGTGSARLPGIDGPHTVMVTAFIDVPMTGKYEIHAGYEDSSYAIALIDGKEVYRRDAGKDAVFTTVKLTQA
jgi:hypothetical protein